MWRSGREAGGLPLGEGTGPGHLGKVEGHGWEVFGTHAHGGEGEKAPSLSIRV